MSRRGGKLLFLTTRKLCGRDPEASIQNTAYSEGKKKCLQGRRLENWERGTEMACSGRQCFGLNPWTGALHATTFCCRPSLCSSATEFKASLALYPADVGGCLGTIWKLLRVGGLSLINKFLAALPLCLGVIMQKSSEIKGRWPLKFALCLPFSCVSINLCSGEDMYFVIYDGWPESVFFTTGAQIRQTETTWWEGRDLEKVSLLWTPQKTKKIEPFWTDWVVNKIKQMFEENVQST